MIGCTGQKSFISYLSELSGSKDLKWRGEIYSRGGGGLVFSRPSISASVNNLKQYSPTTVVIAMWKGKPRFTILVLAALLSVFFVLYTCLRTAGYLPLAILKQLTDLSPYKPVQCSSADSSDPASPCFTPTSKHAYATILTGYNGTDSEKYFTAVRLLAYQFIHDPRTQAKNGARFIVLVTDSVPQENIHILKQYGAEILIVEQITREWIHPQWPRWNDVMAKLNLWTLVDYEKIVFVDADTVLLSRLDDIFLDPATALQQTSPSISEPQEDDGLPPLPEKYMIAGIHDRWIEQNKKPEPGDMGFYVINNYINAGFLVLSPSQEMFKYYLALLDIPNKIDLTYPEQNLLNYVHRIDGRMPWKDVGVHWNSITALGQSFAPDVRSLHHKWWNTLANQTVNDYIAGAIERMRKHPLS